MGLFRAETHASRVARLHAASGAARWNVSKEALANAVAASIRHRWPDGTPPEQEVARYVQSLAIEDLALACGCQAGDDAAWEHFVREFRPALHAAARAIAGDAGRELADGLYADLFGLDTDRPDRRSLFAYYHGRSRLATWLRAVLARRHIDRMRAAGRLESLDESGEEREGRAGAVLTGGTRPVDPERDRLVHAAQTALDAALGALHEAERLRLRLYYGNDLTLAAIGRVFGEHEATVSRKLERARRALRQHVEAALRERGLSDEQMRLCFEHAADAPELHLTRLFSPGGGQ